MKKINFLLITTIIGLFLFSGCTSSRDNAGSSLYSKWILKTMDEKTIVDENTGGSPLYLSFNEKEKSVGGSTGCNILDGKIDVTSSEITFSAMAMTKMNCNDAKYEQNFVGYLFHAEPLKYKIGNDLLTLTKDGKVIMTFEKAK
jgi:heat shock protein HslJ